MDASASNYTLTIKITNLDALDVCNLFIFAMVDSNCYLSVQINHGTSYSSKVVSVQGANINPNAYTWNGTEKTFTIQMVGNYKNVYESKCYAIK